MLAPRASGRDVSRTRVVEANDVGSAPTRDMAVVVVLTVVLPVALRAPLIGAALGESRVAATRARVERSTGRRDDIAEPLVLSIASSPSGHLFIRRNLREDELPLSAQQPR